jgi:hypothetical protein
MLKHIKVYKSGWNSLAVITGPFWYISRRIYAKGFVLLLLAFFTLGIGIIPIWIYCGAKANSDFYRSLKRKQIDIYPYI